MDISNNSVMNKVDLLYLSNHLDYGKIKMKKNKYYDEDYKFYKERVIHQTLGIIENQKMENNNDQIVEILNKYIELSISHFKFVDKRDIIQEDYKDIKKKRNENPNIFSLETTNEILIKDEKTGKITDDFDIQIIRNKKEVKIVFPKIKKINLRDSIFKNKGIGKKENVSNKVNNGKNL